MPGRHRPSLRPLVGALILAVALPACTGSAGGPPPPRAESPTAEPSPFHLSVRVLRVTGLSPRGRPPGGTLRAPTEEVRRTISELYTAGFMDPAQRQEGFEPVLGAFAPATRRRARDEVNQLSLGGAARAVRQVRPEQARLILRFLVDERKRPVSVLADMLFEATGMGDDLDLPIRHRGDYVLRPFGDRWLITGYEVTGRIGT